MGIDSALASSSGSDLDMSDSFFDQDMEQLPGFGADGPLVRAALRGDVSELRSAVASWLGSFGAAKPFSSESVDEALAALRAACSSDSPECVALLLRTSSRVSRSGDCCLTAIAAAAAAGCARALGAALASPELEDFMIRRGPKAPALLAASLASALRASIAAGSPACLNALLYTIGRPGTPAASARPALSPSAIRAALAEAASRGARGAVQALLVCLPEFDECLDASVLAAAASAGQAAAAADIRLLIGLRSGACGGAADNKAACEIAAAAAPHAPRLPSAADVCVMIGPASPGALRCDTPTGYRARAPPPLCGRTAAARAGASPAGASPAGFSFSSVPSSFGPSSDGGASACGGPCGGASSGGSDDGGVGQFDIAKRARRQHPRAGAGGGAAAAEPRAGAARREAEEAAARQAGIERAFARAWAGVPGM